MFVYYSYYSSLLLCTFLFCYSLFVFFFFFKQKPAYVLRIIDWSSDVCSSDLVLEIEDRLAERLALAGVFDRVVEGALRRGLRADRDRKPLLRQFAHQIDEALPLFAEAVGDRHADVVEEKLRRIGLVLPDLVEVAAALESFAVGQIGRAHV